MGAGDDMARTILSSNDGILVAGRSNGQFAIARYRNNGLLDGLFGANGKVITGFGADEAAMSLQIGQDGKILALGASRSGEVDIARYLGVLPQVSVFSLDPNASEKGGNNASLIFTRDQRLDFATRVFFDLGGTATIDADYTGPRILQSFVVTPLLRAFGAAGKVVAGNTGFVDIPAGQTFAVVPITVIDDKAFEGTETVTVSVQKNALYGVGDHPKQEVTIADDDRAQINFQREGATTVPGYVPDSGAVFGNRGGGLKYGWDADNTANARVRGATNSPNFLYDSLNHMQRNGANRKWEIAVPNGTYTVHLVMGDPSNVDSVYKANVENVLAVNGKPTNQNHWVENVVGVDVKDGRLTISNAAGAVNNKICYVEISNGAATFPLRPFTVFGTARATTSKLSQLFSKNQIDELPAMSMSA
jgi:hypothetical protein